MEIQDRRVRRTQHLLARALIALIQGWLDRQMLYLPEWMGVIYFGLIARPTGEGGVFTGRFFHGPAS